MKPIACIAEQVHMGAKNLPLELVNHPKWR
jgi:hypothetical protein